MHAYMDVEGQRVVGPRFHGQDKLSVCLHRRAARLMTFNAASNVIVRQPEVVAEVATIRWAEERGHAAAVKELCNDGCTVSERFWSVGNMEYTNTSERQVHDELQIYVSIVRKGARPADWTVTPEPRGW